MKDSTLLSFLGTENTQEALTLYDIGVALHHSHLQKQSSAAKTSDLTKDYPTHTLFNSQLKTLLNSGALVPFPDFPSSVYRLIGQNNSSLEDIICSIDPFCYLSHLSAMSYHGLTNRRPAKIFISTPSVSEWKSEAQRKMEADLGDGLSQYTENSLPLLTQVRLTRLNKTDIDTFNTSQRGAFTHVQGRSLRVSSIGRTFLDMLRHPERCGDLRHVMEVYEEHAESYLQLIINEVDRHGKPIDKVRAGYILDELLNISHETISSWTQFAQRGGSRKLDASAEYEPVWSEKWCLSLNLD